MRSRRAIAALAGVRLVFLVCLVCLVAGSGVASPSAAQQSVLWTKTKIKVKGDAFKEINDKHLGSGAIATSCYHRVTFDAPDDSEPALRQYCPVEGGLWVADDLALDAFPLPRNDLLLGGEIDVNLTGLAIALEGFFRLEVKRKQGRPRSVRLRHRSAYGQAVEDASPSVYVLGQARVNGRPVRRRQLPPFLQAVAQQREKLMICGDSIRDVEDFVPSGVDLEVVSGCTPDRDTQALLVERSGADTPSDVVLQAYVGLGGIVITESGASDVIFNKIFDADVVDGTPLGDCDDNVAPQVRFGKKDPFWKTFDFSPEPDSGCGYDLQDFPGITPLGGWAELPGSVSLAYRELEDGRVWLVEADWQDGDVAFSETSKRMLGYMIMNR